MGDADYSKRHTRDADLIISPYSINERSDLLSDAGLKYQYAVTAFLAAKLSINDNVVNYRIYSCEESCGIFDDIVTKILLKSPDEVYTSMIRVKYKATKDVAINMIFKENSFSNFDKFKPIFEDSNVRLGIFTNSDICKKKKLSHGSIKYHFSTSLLDKTDDITDILLPCYGMKSKFVCRPAMGTDYDCLFNNCYLCLNQPGLADLTQELKVICDIHDSDAVITYVKSYFSDQSLRKQGMTKHIFETELQRIRFSRFIISTQVFAEFDEHACISAWNDIILTQDVTIINNSEHDIEIERNLLGYLTQRLNSLLGININRKTFEEENLRKEFTEKFEIYFNNYNYRYYVSLPQELDSLLIEFWKIGVLPIILKSDEGNNFEKYIHSGRKYILITNSSRRTPAIPQDDELKIFRDMSDITDVEKRDKLLENVRVSLQGRPPTTLKYLTDGNKELIKTFSTMDVMKLMKPRNLYLKDSCLDGSNNLAFFIKDPNCISESTMEAPYEMGDNIAINCHPDDIDEQIEMFKNKFEYDDYIICVLERSDDRFKLLQGDDWRLRSYFIDQYNQPLYKTREGDLVPVLGTVGYFNERHYIPRCLRKPTIKMPYFYSREERICLVAGDADNITFTKIDLENDGLKLRQKKTYFIKVNEEERQYYWDKLSSLKYPIFDVDIKDNKAELLRYKCSGNLRQHIEYEGDIISEKQFFEDIKMMTGITVITGEPGMGKSSLVKSLYSNIDKYILSYDLTEYKHHRNRLVRFEDLTSTIFQKRASKDYSDFLQELCKQNQIMVVLDSYDEITSTPDFEESALQLIENIARRGIPIITCSRPVLSKSTDVCAMQTVKLEPLNNSKEIEYVEKWGLRVNDLKNVPSEFTGNPLYLNFLRVVAKDPKLFENFSRFKLYEEVVNSKIKRSFARNPHFNSDNVENMKQSFEELALLRLFGKKQTKDVLVSISSKLLFTDQIRTGIITGVDDTIPIFIHFTFVEYFVSQWFVRSLEKPLLKQYAINFYKQLLIDKHARILEIEFEQSSLQNAIVEGKMLRVQQMLRDNLQCLEYIDRFNRTVLHIAAIHCRYHTHRHDPGYKILDKILQSMKNHNPDYISKHDMSGMTWAEYVNKEVFENMVLNNLFTTVEEYLKTEAQNVEESGSSGVFPLDEESFEKIFKVVKWRCLSIHIIRDLIFLQNYHNRKIRKFLEECRNDSPSFNLSWSTGRIDGYLAPLHVACVYCSLSMVQRLVEMSYDVNVTDQYGCTPLYYNIMQCVLQLDEARANKLNITRLLLNNGADVFGADNGCGTILCNGVRSRDISMIRIILDNVSSKNVPKITTTDYVNMQNRDTTSPLHLAIQNSDINIVKLLLDEGADPNLADKYDEISLHAAVNAGNLDVIEELLRRGADINRKNISNRTPLQFAAEKGNTDVLRILLEQNWSNIGNDCVEAACFSAIFGGNPDVMSLLLDRITDLNVTTKNGDTLLHTAVLHGDLNIAALLMERRANKDAKNKWGNTPLYCAVESENNNMVELLLQQGVDPNLGNAKGNTPLHLAADSSNVEIAQLLLEYKAKMNVRNNNHDTPFLFAAGQENVDMVKLLIEQVGDWSIEEEDPAGLLREAIIVGNTDIIRILLSKGLDCNVRFDNAETSLHLAVCIGNLDVIKLLVEKGANVSSENSYGQTAIDIAVSSENVDVIVILRSFER